MLKRLFISLGLCGLLLALMFAFIGAHPAQAEPQAATYFVDRTDDPDPAGLACTNAANDCSLRAAVIAANANLGSTILLTQGGTFTLTRAASGANDATSGDLNITASTTVARACLLPPCLNPTIIGDVGWGDRLVLIGNSTHVNLNNLILRNGHTVGSGGGAIYVEFGGTLKMTNSTVTRNAADWDGGAINSSGTLVLITSTVVGNLAGTPGTDRYGGGIYSSGILTMVNSTIMSNTTYGRGGGLYVFVDSTSLLTGSVVMSNTALKGGGGMWIDGALELIDSSVLGNTAGALSSPLSGGGIYNNTILTLTHSLIANNKSFANGGGILNSGLMTMLDSTVSENVAAHAGGGLQNELSLGNDMLIVNSSVISNFGTLDGGGLISYEPVTIINSTFSGNRTNGRGGGIYLTTFVDFAEFYNVTIANNEANADGDGSGNGGGLLQTAVQMLARYVLIADNVDKSGHSPDCSGTLTSEGYNLIENTTNCTINGTTTGNILGEDPLLMPLQNNGGPTWTHALKPGSPAIDAGDAAGCAQEDQRGVSRPINATGASVAYCDIGAYEYDGPPFEAEPNLLFVPLILR